MLHNFLCVCKFGSCILRFMPLNLTFIKAFPELLLCGKTVTVLAPKLYLHNFHVHGEWTQHVVCGDLGKGKTSLKIDLLYPLSCTQIENCVNPSSCRLSRHSINKHAEASREF